MAYDGFGVHQKMPKAVAALHPQVMAQCLRHTLPQRSGSSQQRSKIEELGRGVYRLNMCAEITSTRRHLHVYRYVCRCVCVYVCVCVLCVCVYMCLCVCMLDLRNRQVYMYA